MPLTKQQLLIPRVLCIGGKEGELIWPWSTLRAGQILKSQIEEGEVSYKFLDPIENDYRFLNQMGIENFPHLFHPLHWSEMREASDLPEYVSYKNKGVFKVDVWDLKYQEAMIFVGDIITTVDIELLQPADESDYQEYQKQKEAK